MPAWCLVLGLLSTFFSLEVLIVYCFTTLYALDFYINLFVQQEKSPGTNRGE